MKELRDIYEQSGSLHHGYVIIGEREGIREQLFSFIQEALNTQTIGNPDFSYNEYPSFTIEAARNLAVPQAMKDVGGERKFFVIATDGITEEAQNALLKMFEEPTPGTHFFIIAPQNNFLPTFLSRLQVIRTGSVEGVEKDFLAKSLPERLAFVTKLTGDISDEKKTKQDAIDLVNAIEYQLSQQGVGKHVAALEACERARASLFSRGAMTKMILENLMLHL